MFHRNSIFKCRGQSYNSSMTFLKKSLKENIPGVNNVNVSHQLTAPYTHAHT